MQFVIFFIPKRGRHLFFRRKTILVFHAFVVACRLFFKIKFFQDIASARNIIRVSNCLDSVSPDLGPNCLQRLCADDKREELIM